MLRFAFLLAFASFSAHADVTIHAFGPDNQIKEKMDGCELSKLPNEYFDNQTQFHTLYDRNSDGKCVRLKSSENSCKPALFLCNTKFYKYSSFPVFVFSNKCIHPSFAGKIFPAGKNKDQACQPIIH